MWAKPLHERLCSRQLLVDNCVVVAIYSPSERLTYCKCNDKEWTPLNAGKFGIGVRDVIFPRGKLHAINNQAPLLVFDNIGVDANTKVLEIAPVTPYAGVAYLAVCSDGGLIAVTRDFDY